jgi:hypothetical protein
MIINLVKEFTIGFWKNYKKYNKLIHHINYLIIILIRQLFKS